MKIKIILSIIFFLYFAVIGATPSMAIYDPTLLPNNIFGIHIVDENDIPAAAELVNSSSQSPGAWGYVTLVIQQNDLKKEKWISIFNQLYHYRLIPIIRLATQVENGVWVKPKVNQLRSWADFLNNLPWPIENRYIILFNEPNHAKEWGGAVNPSEYAFLVKEAIKIFKETNDDFFLLPAGFDLYAPNGNQTMDVTVFWHKMEEAEPGLLSKFDGLASHSYPSNNYTGSPWEKGRHSIVGYKWEIEYLANNFAVNPNLPVFITETGWAAGRKLSRETIADYYQIAFSQIWRKDPQIIAVTPFLLNYQDDLFSSFSWKKPNSDEFYPQYKQVKELAKVKGVPLINPRSNFGLLLTLNRRSLLTNKQALSLVINGSNPQY